jgi:hypothetical protein
VNNKKIHKEFLQGEELPVKILPSNAAWNDMQQRLEKELPDKGIVFVGKRSLRNRIIKGTALLFFLLLTWAILQQTNHGGDGKSEFRGKLANTEKITHDKTYIKQNTGGSDKNTANKNKNTVDDPLQPHTDLPAIKNNGAFVAANHPVGKTKVTIAGKKINRVTNKTSDKKIKTMHNLAGENTLGAKRKKSSQGVKSDTDITVSSLNSSTGKANQQNDDKRLPGLFKDSVNLSSTSKSGVIEKTKPDSLQRVNTENTEESITEYRSIQWGLQWVFQVPLAGMNTYFRGPNVSSQPYRILLPGVWLNFRLDKSAFSIEANPFASGTLPAKSFGTFTSTNQNVDTITTITETKTLRKMFGFSGALAYSYNVLPDWWIGMSLQGYWWRKGIATTSGAEVKNVINSTYKSIKTFNDVYYPMPPGEKDYFTRFQVVGSFQLGYKMKFSEILLRVGMTPLPFSQNQGPKNPLRAEFLYRLNLSADKKAKNNY